MLVNQEQFSSVVSAINSTPKQCTVCDQTKPITEFPIVAGQYNSRRCKVCIKSKVNKKCTVCSGVVHKAVAGDSRCSNCRKISLTHPGTALSSTSTYYIDPVTRTVREATPDIISMFAELKLTPHQTPILLSPQPHVATQPIVTAGLQPDIKTIPPTFTPIFTPPANKVPRKINMWNAFYSKYSKHEYAVRMAKENSMQMVEVLKILYHEAKKGPVPELGITEAIKPPS